MKPLLIDTDPGTDDAMALLMALGSPQAEVLGITTVGGNARLAHTTRNALRVVEYVGRTDVPVASGASRPLRGRFRYAYDFHGPGGLTVRLPRPQAAPCPLPAVALMARILGERPGQVTVVALGPLTNIALLRQAHPHAFASIEELVVMGGVLEAPGNVTPYAEFNVFNDPLAAAQVMGSGIPITLVPLDVCRRTLAAPEDVPRLRRGAREARLAGRILQRWFDAHPGRHYDLCDPLAMAVALDPGIMPTQQREVSVETGDTDTVGRTAVGGESGPVAVPVGLDVERFFASFHGLLGA